jgi:hypothetical protein
VPSGFYEYCIELFWFTKAFLLATLAKKCLDLANEAYTCDILKDVNF